MDEGCSLAAGIVIARNQPRRKPGKLPILYFSHPKKRLKRAR